MVKKMLCGILALLLCAVALAEEAPKAVPGNRLGLKILKELYDGGDNQFVSPVSLAYALSMAAAGADGETRAQLLAALDAQSAEDIAALNEALLASGLRWANAAFVREDTPLRPEYEEALKAFDAQGFELTDAERVNAWAAEHTDGLIDHLLDEVPEDIALMLINAIVMDQQWASPFQPDSTREETFHAPDGDIDVDFMHQTYKSSTYGEADGTQMLRLAYREGELCALLALPPEGGMEDALSALAEQGLGWFRFGEDSPRLALSLPKLDITVSNSLEDAVQAAGAALAFTDDASFSGMSEVPLKIDSILQKVRVEVDEDGTRAAAVTDVMMALGMAIPMPEPVPVVMRLDRPFILVIADEATGAICFAGVVVKP